MDVQEGADGLHRAGMLSMVKKVALAAGVLRVPDEDVERSIIGAGCGSVM